MKNIRIFVLFYSVSCNCYRLDGLATFLLVIERADAIEDLFVFRFLEQIVTFGILHLAYCHNIVRAIYYHVYLSARSTRLASP